jgi:hypothetical protein
MPEALSDARWAAIRTLAEGALPTHERLAAATGVYVKTISRRAGQEKWRTLDFRRKRVGAAHRVMIDLAARAAAGEELDPVDQETDLAEGGFGAAEPGEAMEPWPDLPPAERAARIGAALTRHTETMLRRVEAGQPLESRQVAALSSLVQLSERIALLAREEAREQQAKSDEERAELLQRINDRIVALAEELGAQFARQVLLDQGLSEADITAALERQAAGLGA